MSRRAQRRPAADWPLPPLMASLGSALKIWRRGMMPKIAPAKIEMANETKYNQGWGFTEKRTGPLVCGRQLARAVRATQASSQAQTLARTEITNASVTIWRRIRQRLEPMARRMAISLARSAALRTGYLDSRRRRATLCQRAPSPRLEKREWARP